eukprot:TRINITY_DN67866_c0_g1_i1.p1 TRINITY_DN67866_c0_g1~~TRINITY_DN67866_c0_g1_i1.p1  ORF type:complete len:260 (-),score=57.16 TRINITY_DN67866_c0_g1_i1:298-1077(-)
MAAMVAGYKRMCSFEEELLLLDPHHTKRCRLMDDEDAPGEDYASVVCAAAAALAGSGPESASSSRRRTFQDIDDDCDAEGSVPVDKRLRQMLDSGVGASAGGEDANHDNGAFNASVSPQELRRWAETVVRSLHGCPSVDLATERCSKVLGEFGAEVRQAAVRELEAMRRPPQACDEDSRPQEALEGLQHKNRVLRRAVLHLADRCRRMESGAQEADSLRQALEQSQEAQRRLTHANEVLQGHLKVHLDGCRSDPWVPGH